MAADEHWWSRAAAAARTRYVHGSPQEDERTRHGRAGGGLMVLAATSSLALQPILPPRIDQPMAFLLALGSLVLGLVIPWLPWDRWPRWALLTPIVVTLPVVFVAGGMVDGTLEYYALYLPLVFLYLGLVFPPVYCWWTFLVCLAGLLGALTAGQPTEAVPSVLLGAVLSAVAGAVLAVQRRVEVQGFEAMRALTEAATRLGAASDRQEVAQVVAEAAGELLGADDVEVLLLHETPEPAAVVARRGRGPVGEDDGPVLARAKGVVASLTSGRPASGTVDADVSASSFRLVVGVPGPDGPRGAIVVDQPRRPGGSDRFATRSLEVLAGEAGQVLDRLRRTEELVTSSRTDALTGLSNRAVLREALDASVAGDAYVLMDLDHFKRINDTLGHAMGDQVLVAFAGVLQGAVRPSQVVARYGGEEFVTILPGVDEATIDRHLQHVRQAWARINPHVTFSSGVAVRREGESAAETMARADKALYLAKSAGRNRDVRDPGDLATDVEFLREPSP